MLVWRDLRQAEWRDVWAGKKPNIQASRRILTRPQASDVCLKGMDVVAGKGVVEMWEFGHERRRE